MASYIKISFCTSSYIENLVFGRRESSFDQNDKTSVKRILPQDEKHEYIRIKYEFFFKTE